jgi:hypothetical protein
MAVLGKSLIVIGLITFGLGLIFLFAGKIPILGKLPGDFDFQIGSVKVFAPIATCLLLSLIISLILNLIFRR